MNECIHDGCRHYVEKWSKDGLIKETFVTCEECGASLFTETFDVVTLQSQCIIHNDVYEKYYTRKGRKKWLMEFLEKEGLPIPSCWEE